ncbi:cyclic nucleotide-binding domain-containing protein [Azospirillum soli]|uniref:cyclic nucleotide-binding domain-containing protein n=1 Tax=Azospirillum soli TaxID=1304799 RepID=UPI001AE21B58|nr:cyclic nucleotide-binding domain-containing protein [Azospirillum soli]MBP2311568.1 CRP-like cAMP-binding protein [Azospirillum soli]
MSIAQEVECLRKIPMFANVEISKLKLLAFTSERVTYKPGEVLFHQDEMGTCAFIILSGEAEVEVRTPAGPLAVATLGASEIVGEIAILCDVPRTATVRALSELDALCVPKDHFLQMIADFPQMALEIMRALAHRLDKTTGRLREVLSGQGV